ncbi:hypothetical protein PhCBS80983_g06287 [Powellomyces hirtus]|uniref:Major facilitator superfamily (MFS) profile domain-containing protein n=1 Tax=Powellomyces hirtus TaxID=109895 RepID=A0A507DP40_9FUNG|nr:hypothetical protein PhCBS80983_g06287 [Powellomyces hirtus]
MAKNVYNFLVAFGAAMGGLLFGYEIGVMSQVLVMYSTFGMYFGIVDPDPEIPGKYIEKDSYANSTGNLTMSFLGGAILGAALVSYVADFAGRKRSIFVGGLFFCGGGCIQAASQNLNMLIGGRIVSGFGVGFLAQVVPIYIAETAPAHLRGALVAIQQFMLVIGILIASCVNAVVYKFVTSQNQWRIALGIQVVPGLVLLFLNMFLPFSPRWLANKDRNEEAIKILATLRGLPVSDSGVQAEFAEITEHIALERQVGTASFSELLKPGIRNRVFIGFMIQVCQQWTGINFILYYIPNIIEKIGFSQETASIPFTISNNMLMALATIPGLYWIERTGRRKLMMTGAAGMCACLLVTCLSVAMSKEHGAVWGWIAVLSIFSFTANFAFGWGAVPWVYPSEIFPLRIRSKGMGIATMSNLFWNGCIGKVSPLIAAKIDYWIYLVFAVACVLMGIWTYFYIPETMGLSLEDIDVLFGGEKFTSSVDAHVRSGKSLEGGEVMYVGKEDKN